MDLHAHWVRVVRGRPKALHCADFAWVPVEDIARYALPVADQKIFTALRKAGVFPAF
jgi:hypothetical protein